MSTFHSGHCVAPSSIGSLIEPSFLRDAASDAHGEHRFLGARDPVASAWKVMTGWVTGRRIGARAPAAPTPIE